MLPFSLAPHYSGNLLLSCALPRTTLSLLRNGAHAASRSIYLRIRSWRRGVEAVGDQRGEVRQNVCAHVLVLSMAARTLGVFIGVGVGEQGHRTVALERALPSDPCRARSAEVPGGTRPRQALGKQQVDQIFAAVRSRCSRNGNRPHRALLCPADVFCPNFLPGKTQMAVVPGAARTGRTKPAPAGSTRLPLTFLDVGSGRSQRPHPLAHGAMPLGLWAQGRPRTAPGAGPGNSGAGGRGQGCLSYNRAHRAGKRQGSAVVSPKKAQGRDAAARTCGF